LDSKYSDPDGTPGDGEDSFPLVEDYGGGDDHAPDNAPCLICELANAMNTTNKAMTYKEDMIYGIENWIADANLEHKLEFHFYEFPSFEFVAGEIEQGKAVTLAVSFLEKIGDECISLAGHLTACAAVNSDEFKIALSDPFWDIENPPGNPEEHNDPQNVSHDMFEVSIGSPCSNYPEIQWWLPSYPYWEVAVIYGAGVFNATNERPEPPTIDGPLMGKKGVWYNFTFNSVDPDGDDVYYYILWGDGYIEKWEGPFSSGQDFVIAHSYPSKRTYTIEAKVKDTCNAVSNWSYFDIEIPRTRTTSYLWYQWFLERFPLLERLLSLVKEIF